MGGLHGYGVGGADDDDLSAPLGTFGKTGGHRQDLDSAGAYVVAEDDVVGALQTGHSTRGHGKSGVNDQAVAAGHVVAIAGPEGEDLSHAIGSANANRHDPTFQTYVAEEPALVPASEEAATLTSGSHPNSRAPGRKREDDENLVVASQPPSCLDADGTVCGECAECAPFTLDWQAGGTNDTSFRGKSRAWIDDKPGSPSRALSSTKVPAVHIPATGFNAGQDDTGASGEEVSPPVVGGNGQTPNAVAFDLRGREEGVAPEIQGDETSALRASPGGSSRSYVAFRQTPQGDIGTDDETAYPVMNNDGSGNNRTLLAAKPLDEPHVYFPNYEAQGDCVTCGRVEEDEIHVSVEVANTLKGQRGKGGGGVGPEETLVPTIAYGFGSHAGSMGDASNESHDAGGPVGQGITEEASPSLRAGRTQAVAYAKLHGSADSDDPEHWAEAEVSRTLEQSGFTTTAVVDEVADTLRQHPRPGSNTDGAIAPASSSAVRRLTPTECERLQGFPDGWTDIDPGSTPDGPRYAALGDAVTVNVAEWIVRRLLRRRELGLE